MKIAYSTAYRCPWIGRERAVIVSSHFQFLDLPNAWQILLAKFMMQIFEMLLQILKIAALGPMVREVIQVSQVSTISFFAIGNFDFMREGLRGPVGNSTLGGPCCLFLSDTFFNWNARVHHCLWRWFGGESGMIRAIRSAQVLLTVLCLGSSGGLIAGTFQRIQLTGEYFAEGGAFGDFNGDGTMDVVAGPWWYEGPSYQVRHEIQAPKPQDRNRYADNFFSFPGDFNADGRLDVLVVGFPGTPAYWYENPGQGKTGRWPRHEALDWVSNESPALIQLVGDERPELVCTRRGSFGYATYDPSQPDQSWTWHPVSDAIATPKFGHGLGVGDVNGDGRLDILHKDGWIEQPASLSDRWPRHEFVFTPRGGAQMFCLDVDADGDADVITSLAAHEHGLSWFEQKPDAEKGITFVEHPILGKLPWDRPDGVVFSELHAVALEDMNRDGLPDIVTGRTWWSHHMKTVGWHDDAVVYWFELNRDGGKVRWIPHEADNDSGLGRQVHVMDANGDGFPDIIGSNMRGTHLLLHPGAGKQPVVGWPAPKGKVSGGVLPKDAQGRPLNTDFETGDLRDWTAEGEAFQGQPAEGEIDPNRKWGEGKTAKPRGRFWMGGFERVLSDAPTGTLTSTAFEITHPWASYLIGGGAHRDLRFEIVRASDDRVVFVSRGRQNERMRPEVVDLRPMQGERVYLRLVDRVTGGFGHLNFDEFRFHEKFPADPDAVTMPRPVRPDGLRDLD